MPERQGIVLIVDDDLAVRESLKFALALEGLAVRACGSGEELLRHPDLAKARCLVVDYKMPVMDGFEVLARLDAGKFHPPVIMITGHVNATVRRRAAKTGIRHVLEKPLSDSALVDSIRDVLHHPQPPEL
jgi:two-component system, LuxR family, response regulator FixJ